MEKRKKEIKIWEGIYKDFDETGAKDDAFNGKTWTSNSLKKLKELLKEKSGTYREGLNQDELLPMLVAGLSSDIKKMKVLDFGGGLGLSYVQILKRVQNTKDIEFHIVEKKAVCDAGSEFFKKDRRVRFSSSLPSAKKFDLIHLRSSIQYIDDWKGLLRRMASYKPRFFLFLDLFTGDVPTYVSVQNYYGSKIPCRFINSGEFIKEMKKLGFEPSFRSPFLSTFFGKLGNFPQSNLPARYRIKNSQNMLFFNTDG